MEPDAVTSLCLAECLAEIEDLAYVLAILAFSVLSWVIGLVKKRKEETEGTAEPSSEDTFEQAELVEDESTSPQSPLRSLKLHLSELAEPQTPAPLRSPFTSPPKAKPANLPPHTSMAQSMRSAWESPPSARVPPIARSSQQQAVALETSDAGSVLPTVAITKPDSTDPIPSAVPSNTLIAPPVAGSGIPRSRWSGFATIKDVRQAIVMAEILGPPVALRESGRCPGDPGSDGR